MATVSSFLLCLMLLSADSLASASPGLEHITAHSGDKVTLPCHGPKNDPIMVLEWSKSNHKENNYVFLFRDERPYADFQDPSFMNRVELKDGQLTDGDVSVNLINVMSNDSGIYECRVFQSASKANLPTEPIARIYLNVTEGGTSGQRGGKVQEHTGLILFQLFVLTLFVVLKY